MAPHDEALLRSSAVDLEKTAAAPRALGLLKRLGPPIFCFALSRLLLHLAAISTGYDPLDTNSWSRWDSVQYLSIASTGYGLRSCAGLRGYDRDDWCGNDAWLPGYSILIKLIAETSQLTYIATGVIVSAVFTFAALLTIWVLFLKTKLTAGNLMVLLTAAFFPGHVYDHAVFPVSQFTFFTLLSLWLYSQRRFATSGLCAAVAAFSYSSGIFLCGVFFMQALVLERGRLTRMPLKNLALPCGGVLLGFSGALTLQWLQTGVWNAFFLVQKKYAYSPRTPFEAWRSNLRLLLENWPRIDGPVVQTLFVAGLCGLMLGVVLWRRAATRLDVLLIAFALTYWLIPIALGGQLSLYRAEATLLPAVPLARKIPWPLLVVLVCVAIIISWLMARDFFAWTLV